MKKKPSRTTIRNRLDKVAGQITRGKGYCEWCWNKKGQLQTAHIFSRKNLSTRWHMPNLLCLCASCHFKAHQNPILFTEFVRIHLGEDDYEALKKRAITSVDWDNDDLMDIYNMLKEQGAIYDR